MRTKHTKGNWEIIGHLDGYESGSIPVGIIDSSNRTWLAEAKSNHVNPDMSDEEWKANAMLIAAAPDLLDALTYYFEVLDEVRGENWAKSPDHVMQRMLNAVSKATGKTF